MGGTGINRSVEGDGSSGGGSGSGRSALEGEWGQGGDSARGSSVFWARDLPRGHQKPVPCSCAKTADAPPTIGPGHSAEASSSRERRANADRAATMPAWSSRPPRASAWAVRPLSSAADMRSGSWAAARGEDPSASARSDSATRARGASPRAAAQPACASDSAMAAEAGCMPEDAGVGSLMGAAVWPSPLLVATRPSARAGGTEVTRPTDRLTSAPRCDPREPGWQDVATRP